MSKLESINWSYLMSCEKPVLLEAEVDYNPHLDDVIERIQDEAVRRKKTLVGVQLVRGGVVFQATAFHVKLMTERGWL